MTTNETTPTQATAFDPTAVKTTTVDISYHFKAFGPDREPHARLVALMEEGKLNKEDVEVIKDGDTEKLKRKSLTVKAEVPVLEIPGWTEQMNSNLQKAVIKMLEAANKENIDKVTGKWVDWATVMQQEASRAGGGAKVTAELVEAVTAAFTEYMEEAGYPEAAVELISEAGAKRFSANVCRGIKIDVLSKIDTIVTGWYEQLDDESAETVEPVVSLWKTNIDKLVNPKTDVSADMFEL